MKPVPVEVVHNHSLAPRFFRLGLKPLEPLSRGTAGQFYMVRVSRSLDPLLRRPLGHFGYYRTPDPEGSRKPTEPLLEFFYQVVGRGTRLLSELKPGETTDLLGPLGRGWRPAPGAERLILVAGGMGIVPLRGLADQQRAQGDKRRMTLLWGVKRGADLCGLEDLEALEVELRPASEDGAYGHRGLATDLLEPTLAECGRTPVAVFACGPWAMLKRIAEITRRQGIPCQVSLDAFMACGLGACLTCAVRSRDEPARNLRVCKEGPVFGADEIDWTVK